MGLIFKGKLISSWWWNPITNTFTWGNNAKIIRLVGWIGHDLTKLNMIKFMDQLFEQRCYKRLLKKKIIIKDEMDLQFKVDGFVGLQYIQRFWVKV